MKTANTPASRRPSLIALGLALLLAVAASASARPPNIIHIMADDLGWRDLGVYGSETYETPNLDRLAAKGMVFSEGYAASPLCSPTRASTLSGQTVSRIRVTAPTGHIAQVVLDPTVSRTNSPGLPATDPGTRSRMPMETVTYARLLGEAGYATAFLGKWHLGHPPYVPENFGFGLVVGGRGTPGPPQGRFFGPWDPEADNVPAPADRPDPDAVRPNIDDVLGDYAVQFIEENRDRPFLINLWLYNVHAPYQGEPAEIAAAREQAELGIYQQSAVMASMVKAVDDNVGKVIDALEREGLWDETLVVFTSDNGGNMYDRPEGVNPTNNHPLHAGKGNNYEGGVRVPLIAAWPGVVPEGSLSDVVAVSYDWFPTFLEMAGLSAPAGWTLDGVSLLPVLRGEPFERGPVFSSFPHTVLATGNYANVWVREGRWKLLRFFNAGPGQADAFELYDLKRDPGETRNRIHEEPEVAARLKSLLEAQLAAEGAQLPLKNPQFDPDFRQAGFRMVDGGRLVGGPNQTQAVFTAKADRVTLSYDLAGRGAPGDVLAFSVVSNSAVSVVAGPADTPVFGPPVAIVPDLAAQEIRVPLGRRVDSGELTVVFDLEQPGRTHITNPRMIDGGEDSYSPPRVVDGIPELSFEGDAPGRYGDWEPRNDIATAEVVDGVLRVRSAGSDPFFVMTQAHFPPEAVQSVEVRLRSDEAGFAELFWSAGPRTAFSQARSLKADVAGTGEWEILRFPVGAHPNWGGGRITALRIDPINAAHADFEIESVILK